MKVMLWIKILLLTAIVGILGLFASLWVEHRTTVTLPEPTGPFAIGRTIYDWKDTKHELLVWIWYPADPSQTGVAFDDYLPASVRPPASQKGGVSIFRLLTRDLSKVHGHSLRITGVSPQQQSYPMVIMRAGAAAPVMSYSTLAEDLASHGYIVVGFDAPYRTTEVVFPDGRVIARSPENNPELFSGETMIRVANKLVAAWAGDIGFVLDRLKDLNATDGKFKGRLDLERIGVLGHSLGGATAAQFCAQDPRCKAGIDIDGALLGPAIRAGIHKPFMFLLSGLGDFSSDAETRQFMSDIQSVYDRLPPEARLRISIRGSSHFTFSDDGALLKSFVFRGALRLFGKLKIDGRRQLAITAQCVRSFFGTYLKVAEPLEISSRLYPEIQVLR